jgi:hypothetical protein
MLKIALFPDLFEKLQIECYFVTEDMYKVGVFKRCKGNAECQKNMTF